LFWASAWDLLNKKKTLTTAEEFLISKNGGSVTEVERWSTDPKISGSIPAAAWNKKIGEEIEKTLWPVL
jgi:hypothetical protein